MDGKPAYRAWFQSIQDPSERYALDEIVYKSRDGHLLEVVHDLAELRKTSAAGWKKIFRERAHVTDWPYGSGVWGKKEWVLPTLDPENVVSMYEGNTNLFWAERYGRELGVSELWIKQCGNSHTGSFKDLGMTVLVSMVKEMIARGKPIPAVACASTGDTSAALAAYAAAAGIPAVVFLPRGKVSVAQLIQPVANGAIVFALDTDFDGCMEIVQQVAERDGIYLANSMNSLRIEGQKTVGIEIVEQFDWEMPDWMVIPGGNLGNVSALAKGIDMLIDLGLVTRRPRIVCAQAQAANPLYLSYQRGFEVYEPIAARPTLASAIQIGNPVSIQKAIDAIRRYDGIVEQASEAELAEACARADRTGLFNCPHTGVALAATEKLVARGVIKKNDRVVVISTAHGLKFVEMKVKLPPDDARGDRVARAQPPDRAARALRSGARRDAPPDRPALRRALARLRCSPGSSRRWEGGPGLGARRDDPSCRSTRPRSRTAIKIGDSVSVNGGCLTVVAVQQGRLDFDADPRDARPHGARRPARGLAREPRARDARGRAARRAHRAGPRRRNGARARAAPPGARTCSSSSGAAAPSRTCWFRRDRSRSRASRSPWWGSETTASTWR